MIGSQNTGYGDEKSVQKYPRPKIYGVAVNVETGDIFPADFLDGSKCPDAELRFRFVPFFPICPYDRKYFVRL